MPRRKLSKNMKYFCLQTTAESIVNDMCNTIVEEVDNEKYSRLPKSIQNFSVNTEYLMYIDVKHKLLSCYAENFGLFGGPRRNLFLRGGQVVFLRGIKENSPGRKQNSRPRLPGAGRFLIVSRGSNSSPASLQFFILFIPFLLYHLALTDMNVFFVRAWTIRVPADTSAFCAAIAAGKRLKECNFIGMRDPPEFNQGSLHFLSSSKVFLFVMMPWKTTKWLSHLLASLYIRVKVMSISQCC